MNIELRHLRALAAIGDAGTITGAAAELRISQPALSRTLDQLERRVGGTLVERTTRSLRLTETGRRLCEQAHRILAELDEALAEARSGARPLRVGFAWAALGAYTVPLLRDWRRAHPDTPAEVHRLDDPETALRRGEVDVAFLRTEPADDGALITVPLYEEPRLAAVCEGDPLAGRAAVELADLAGRTIALCATASTTTAELWPTERRPRTTVEVTNVDEWLTVIATGEAVGVTAEATGHTHPHPGVRYVPITDAPHITVRAARRRDPHPEGGAFIERALHVIA
ncbi:LysR family transcriptional regulator [Streptomyces halobius]|uniref:LysR family transcriptional regulator n=1 Tax=Streptomyces halobius TaxID=2879846 RepID=A0ABY4M660_9ACTN|nr:LysR family transcriptional regulator [Streptomyces halobius]UQA93158.1 LysR family transcriptional regulator [Streptomyces halobius]